MDEEFDFGPDPVPSKATAPKKSGGIKVTKRATPAGGRVKVMWVVLNGSLREFGRFPYNERDRAEAFAEFAQSKCSHGDKYVVQPLKVPME